MQLQLQATSSQSAESFVRFLKRDNSHNRSGIGPVKRLSWNKAFTNRFCDAMVRVSTKKQHETSGKINKPG